MGNKSAVSIFLVIVAVWLGAACRTVREPTEYEAAIDEQSDGVEKLGARAEKALVRVLVYGHFVLDTNSSKIPTLRIISPGDSTHSESLWRGEYNSFFGSFRWKSLASKATLRSEKTVRIYIDPVPAKSLILYSTGVPIVKEPSGSAHARDFKWTLGQKEISGQSKTIDDSKAAVSLLIDDGQVETCALVHSASWTSCVLEAGGAERAMAEYLVMWKVIPATSKVYVKLGGQKKLVAPTGDRTLDFEKFYDIAFRNVDESATHRSYKTKHVNGLRGIFKDPPAQWNEFSTDPSHCQSSQAACIERYKNWGGASGYDRPICPFIEES